MTNAATSDLLGFLLGDGLAVTRALLRAVRHQLLVVLLRILFVDLVGLHLHLEVLRQLLDQCHGAPGVLLLVPVLSRSYVYSFSIYFVSNARFLLGVGAGLKLPD